MWLDFIVSTFPDFFVLAKVIGQTFSLQHFKEVLFHKRHEEGSTYHDSLVLELDPYTSRLLISFSASLETF